MTVILRTEWESKGIEIDPPPDVIEDVDKTTDPISCDIQLNGVYKYPMASKSDEIPPGGFVLKPGRLVIAESLQKVALPNDVTGIISSKAKKTYMGLIGPNTKIDPHFRGPLKLALFNAGDQPIRLKKDEVICSMFFLSMEHGGGKKRWIPQDTSPRRNTFLAILRRNTPHLYTLGLSLLGACVIYTALDASGASAQGFLGGIAGFLVRLLFKVWALLVALPVVFVAAYAGTLAARRRKGSGSTET